MTPITGATSVAQLLTSAAARWPQGPALVEGDVVTNYAALAGRAGALAAALQGKGLKPGERVAILLPRGANAAAVIFGTYAAGGVAVVLNDRLRPRQIEHVLSDCGATVLITGAEELARLPRDIGTSATLLDVATLGGEQPFEPLPRAGSDLAQIIYTSGSTGLPKGVVYPHATLLAGVRIVSSYLGLLPSDRVVSLLAFSAVYGLNQLLCCVAIGSTLVIERSPLATEVVAGLRRHGITVAAAVPPLWTQLLAVPDFQQPIATLRQLQNAGGHLPVESVRRLRAAQPQAALFLQYGMTETWRGTFLPPGLVDERPGSMGLPVPEAELLVVREDGALCQPGEVGELVHAGPTIGSGYWNRPGDETFRAHPLRPGERAVFSGDMVKRDPGGFLYYVGRRDRMIKTQGFRIGPDEIAEVLYASGLVEEAVVSGEDDAGRGMVIVAWVVLRAGAAVDALKKYCRVELPPYMQPARFEVRDQLPRLPGGKYDLAALGAKTP